METVAVILTGGRSSRMGRDKCALRLGGETFLERLVERYRGAFGRVCVSVDRPGRFDPAGAEEVCDRRPGRQGPLAGLEAAFLQTGAEAIFLTAVDLPFGDAALARRLEQLRGTADACCIRRAGGWSRCSRSMAGAVWARHPPAWRKGGAPFAACWSGWTAGRWTRPNCPASIWNVSCSM